MIERFFADLTEKQIRRGFTDRPPNWSAITDSRPSTRSRSGHKSADDILDQALLPQDPRNRSGVS